MMDSKFQPPNTKRPFCKLVFRNWLLFVICNLVIGYSLLFAQEITIIYTGQTHAMLYTCTCPVETDGGVARRASLIKQIKKEKPAGSVLVVDSGNFFAAGILDEFSQDTALNSLRNEYNLKALLAIGYDALCLGDDEFNFGADYLKEKIQGGKFNFVSSNISLKSAAPEIPAYIIKQVSGIKAAIIGLTAEQAAIKSAGSINFIRPDLALRHAIFKAKQEGANFIVVLSNLAHNQNVSFLSQVDGVDVLVANESARDKVSEKVNNTVIVYPSWQGRKLGVLSLKLEGAKIQNYQADLIRLSDKVGDDPEITKIMPRCFMDINCRNKSAIGVCQNPSEMKASCQFPQARKIKLTVITHKDCLGCDYEHLLNLIKRDLPGAQPAYVYYPEDRAKKLIKDLKINFLPAYVLPKDIDKQPGFSGISGKLEDKGSLYLIKPEFSGVAMYLDRPKKDGLDLFLSIYDKASAQVLENSIGTGARLHFLAIQNQAGFDAMQGNLEVEEYLRAVCVEKYYPDQYWDYVLCRSKNLNSSWWQDCLTGADQEKIHSCATTGEGKDLLSQNISLSQQLRIMMGPAYLLNNQQIFSLKQPLTNKQLKEIIQGR
ncbi:MAG: hypothetical protein MUF05_05840 [Candidatus Omnitrophica bacterium]|jgi:hypothetical protein|nr:hypothetical protein [Candidatus Omnitrophota bacterium]